MYFNYHAKAKKMLREGKLRSWSIVEDYHGIRPALLLRFEDGSVLPIREYRFSEYLPLLSEEKRD